MSANAMTIDMGTWFCNGSYVVLAGQAVSREGMPFPFYSVVDEYYLAELLDDIRVASETLAHYEKHGLADAVPFEEYWNSRRVEEE